MRVPAPSNRAAVDSFSAFFAALMMARPCSGVEGAMAGGMCALVEVFAALTARNGAEGISGKTRNELAKVIRVLVCFAIGKRPAFAELHELLPGLFSTRDAERGPCIGSFSPPSARIIGRQRDIVARGRCNR